ncbi:LLM class flavin-dependent oxidoreductase [Mycoplasmatota bacterium]|nr:LLM class flavin-dependent oxidoreductase [Mycoplasmatota bacterium]
MKEIQFGLMTFLETGLDETSGMISSQQRIKNALEEIKLADQLNIDYFGIGEHHRHDYAATSPITILSAAATITKQIKLGTAVTVLSSEDPVRLYEQFSTLDIISNGRAEIMAGRGSFVESFPLFGYDLKDYDMLFSEKLDLLLNIRQHENLNWEGKHRQKLEHVTVYPRDPYDLKISVGVGGSYDSVVRAAKLGLPIVFAIIGGDPLRFKVLIDLYKKTYMDSGHPIENMEISVALHGLVTNDVESIHKLYYPATKAQFEKIGQERGWGNQLTYASYLESIKQGHLFIGTPENIKNRIYQVIKHLDIQRFILHTPGSIMPHDITLESIKLYGEIVIPELKSALKNNL